MGKYKFRLSDMLPNAWFYKLKDMSNNTREANQINTKKKSHQPLPLPTSTFASSSKPTSLAKARKSYYFTRELHNNSNTNSRGENRPRKSPIQKPKKSSCSSVTARCRVSNESLFTKSEEKSTSSSRSSSSELEFRCDSVLATVTFDNMVNMASPNEKDIIFNVENSSKIDSFSDLELPRIITKPESFTTIKNKNKKKQNQPMKSPRIKLRINSPRIGNRNMHRNVNSTSKLSSSSNRRSRISESFAIVKSSFDPQRDFRESMIEMIMENNIKASKDLEDLLACYLSLNADEYHDLIIKVFKQIWFDLTCIKSKYSK